jgi:hypothetical protein
VPSFLKIFQFIILKKPSGEYKRVISVSESNGNIKDPLAVKTVSRTLKNS